MIPLLNTAIKQVIDEFERPITKGTFLLGKSDAATSSNTKFNKDYFASFVYDFPGKL